jgi:hypothetical protein
MNLDQCWTNLLKTIDKSQNMSIIDCVGRLTQGNATKELKMDEWQEEWDAQEAANEAARQKMQRADPQFQAYYEKQMYEYGEYGDYVECMEPPCAVCGYFGNDVDYPREDGTKVCETCYERSAKQ